MTSNVSNERVGFAVNFYCGIVFNPRIGSWWDWKMFLYIAGAVMLQTMLLAAVVTQYAVYGVVGSSLAVYCALFTAFVVDYMYHEHVHLYTYDLFAERVGFKLTWGCLCFYPFFYSLGVWSHVGAIELATDSWLECYAFDLAGALFFVLGWALSRGANMQKYHFKLDPKAHFLGIAPVTMLGLVGPLAPRQLPRRDTHGGRHRALWQHAFGTLRGALISIEHALMGTHSMMHAFGRFDAYAAQEVAAMDVSGVLRGAAAASRDRGQQVVRAQVRPHRMAHVCTTRSVSYHTVHLLEPRVCSSRVFSIVLALSLARSVSDVAIARGVSHQATRERTLEWRLYETIESVVLPLLLEVLEVLVVLVAGAARAVGTGARLRRGPLSIFSSGPRYGSCCSTLTRRLCSLDFSCSCRCSAEIKYRLRCRGR